MESLEADITCLTEGCRELLAENDFVIKSDPDHGYPLITVPRQSLRWSRHEWTDLDNFRPSFPLVRPLHPGSNVFGHPNVVAMTD